MLEEDQHLPSVSKWLYFHFLSTCLQCSIVKKIQVMIFAHLCFCVDLTQRANKTRKSLINGGRVKLESGCSPSGSTLNNVWTVNHYHQFNRILARVYELKDSHAGVWDKSYSDVCRNQSNVFSSGPSCFVFPDNTFTHSVSGEPLRKLDFSSSANASGTMSTVSVETTLLCNNSIINR